MHGDTRDCSGALLIKRFGFFMIFWPIFLYLVSIAPRRAVFSLGTNTMDNCGQNGTKRSSLRPIFRFFMIFETFFVIDIIKNAPLVRIRVKPSCF